MEKEDRPTGEAPLVHKGVTQPQPAKDIPKTEIAAPVQPGPTVPQPAHTAVTAASSARPQWTTEQRQWNGRSNNAWEESYVKHAIIAAIHLAQWHALGFESLGARPQPDAPTPCELFRRLSTFRDLDSKVIDLASHAGGIASAPELGKSGFSDSPYIIDPGNKKYGEIGRYLLKLLSQQDIAFIGRNNFDFFCGLGDERFGDYLETYLAAASIAYNRENNRPDIYYYLVGGSHGNNDLVTPMLRNLLSANPRTLHPGHGAAAV